MYSQPGEYIFSQVILWRRDPATQKLHVGYWELVDRDKVFPVKRYNLYKYRTTHGEAYSQLFRESWSQIDPERSDKRQFAEEDRIGLPTKPKQE